MAMPNCGRAPMRAAHIVLAFVLAFSAAWPAPAASQPLTLMEAFARAAAADPGLPAAQARIGAAAASVMQAGRSPNPHLSLLAENFVGTGAVQGFERTETTLSYSQVYERGNKREARVSVAGAELEMARLRRQVRALDLYLAVETAWVEALAAGAGIALREERLAAAERLRDETARRVEAARDPLFAGSRTTALVAEAQVALTRARSADATARAALAAYWSGPSDFQLDMGALEATMEAPPPNGEDIDLALLEAQRQAAAARVGLEESRAFQDPTFQGGLRHFGLGNDLAFVAGVSIPLPLYDDNSGNIARAAAEREAAERDILAAGAARQREIAFLSARIAASGAEARSLESAALPEAERALELARDGFARGGFGYIDIIEAERALAAVRAQRLDALISHHLDIARLNRLTGHYAAIIPSEEPR